VNLTNIKLLRDVLVAEASIVDHESTFNMDDWIGGDKSNLPHMPNTASPADIANIIHNCGTSACLAGYAVLISNNFPIGATSNAEVQPRAQAWLDLTSDQTSHMFFGYWAPEFPESDNIPASLAVEYLDHVIATGDVDYVTDADHVGSTDHVWLTYDKYVDYQGDQIR
jgi:hypothetical protein